MPLAARLYQWRDEEFDHKRLLVEWTPQLIHEVDMQALPSPVVAVVDGFNGYCNLGFVAAARELHVGALNHIGVVLEERRTHLDMHNVFISERAQACQRIVSTGTGRRYRCVTTHQAHPQRITLAGMDAQRRFDQSGGSNRDLLLSQEEALHSFEEGLFIADRRADACDGCA